MSWCIDSKADTLAHQHLDLPNLRKRCMKFGDIWKDGLVASSFLAGGKLITYNVGPVICCNPAEGWGPRGQHNAKHEHKIKTMHRRECVYRNFGTSVLKELLY